MVIKTYNVQLLENLMYLKLHPPEHWKLHPCEKFHLWTLVIPHWPMNEPKFYPQIQILHICVVSFLWAELINAKTLMSRCNKCWNISTKGCKLVSQIGWYLLFSTWGPIQTWVFISNLGLIGIFFKNSTLTHRVKHLGLISTLPLIGMFDLS
jgi:hypothetical protein